MEMANPKEGLLIIISTERSRQRHNSSNVKGDDSLNLVYRVSMTTRARERPKPMVSIIFVTAKNLTATSRKAIFLNGRNLSAIAMAPPSITSTNCALKEKMSFSKSKSKGQNKF